MHFSRAFVLTLKGWLILSWVTEISYYSLGHGLKRVASLFLVGSHMTRSTVSFSSNKRKQNSSNLILRAEKKKKKKKKKNRGVVSTAIANSAKLYKIYIPCKTQKSTHKHTHK